MYDELNRLTSAQGAYGTLSYSYDKIGNMRTKEGVTLSYDPIVRPHAVSSTTSGRSFVYDDNGNMTSDGQRTITYNYDNMPLTINGGAVNFVYDGNGVRVKKISASGTRVYLDKFYECTGGVCGKYIFAGNDRVVLKTPTQTLYYHPDHLGSTSVVTDGTGANPGNKYEDIVYYPFGKSYSDTSSSGGVNHKFTSQELDAETGLYNYGARLYDPEIGRFVSADSKVTDPTNPQSLNRYSYVINNPLFYTDPTGNDFWSDLADFFKDIFNGFSMECSSNGDGTQCSAQTSNAKPQQGGGGGNSSGGDDSSPGYDEAMLQLHQYAQDQYSNYQNTANYNFSNSGVGSQFGQSAGYGGSTGNAQSGGSSAESVGSPGGLTANQIRALPQNSWAGRMPDFVALPQNSWAGIQTAVINGGKGALSALQQGGDAVFGMAINGPPVVQGTLAFALTTVAAPLAFATGPSVVTAAGTAGGQQFLRLSAGAASAYYNPPSQPSSLIEGLISLDALYGDWKIYNK